MAEASLSKSLAALEKEAKRLSEASNRTNKLIEVVQERLRAAGVGIDFWLEKPTLEYGLSTYTIGYCKIEKDWQLVVKRADRLGSIFSNTPETLVPLSKASREIRSEALPLLPALVDGLSKAITRKADQLEAVATQLEE